MSKSGDYWRKRFEQMEDAQHNTSMKQITMMQEQFDKAQAAISGKINAWYQRFAENNGISMTEARKMLSNQELKELKWNIEDYIKYGKENKVSGAWVKQLENASARVHISRLEALKLEVQQEAEKLFGNFEDSVDSHIRNIYANDFYHTAYEIQKGIGVGSRLQALDDKVVSKIVSKPWAVDGKNFSERIWDSKTKLINNAHNSLSRMCITGESPDRAIREIANAMKVSKSQAGRLVMTESAAFANKAREDCMNDLGVEEFEFVATLDSITSEICREMDGKHYPMSEYVIGVTAPPLHPNCRSCTCPYFDDEFTVNEKRAARGEDGKTYYVPADMTYQEWKKSFVDGGNFTLDMQNAQEYRPINKAAKEHIEQRGQIEIHTRKIVNSTYGGEVYLSDSVKIKRKQMHEMETSLNQAVEFVGKDGKLPKCVVITPEEMQTGAVCAYNARKNVMYINSVVTDTEKLLKLQEGMACPDNPLSTYVHEFIHWKDAQEYLKKNELINSKEYLQELRKKCKKKLDTLEQQGYDIKRISSYATTSYKAKQYDEMWTEYRVLKLLEGGK